MDALKGRKKVHEARYTLDWRKIAERTGLGKWWVGPRVKQQEEERMARQ